MEIDPQTNEHLLAELDRFEQELDKANRMMNKWKARVTSLQASINVRRRLAGKDQKAS